MDDFRKRTKIEITLADLDNMQAEAKSALSRVAELEKQVLEIRLADPTGTVKLLHAAFHEAMKVVQFAVGNLEPSTVRGWPYAALFEIANAIDKIPGVDLYVSEMGIDLRTFAQLAAGYEAFRKERDAKRVVMSAGPSDFGPKTAEAEFVHVARQRHLDEESETD